MKEVFLYIHGKGGSADEAKYYQALFKNAEVVGLDYIGQTPWDTKDEFNEAYRRLSKQYDNIGLIANSIGAYFAMNAFLSANIGRAFFISPIVDMTKLISDMMHWAGVDEKELQQKQKIVTPFGETLSWDWLCYVRNNPIDWHVPTDILYGENDNLTSIETITSFAQKHQATLTVMKGGEHWFHTDEEMKFLSNWLKEKIR